MRISNLDVVLKDMEGKEIKTVEIQNNQRQTVPMTLRKQILEVLRTDKIMADDRRSVVTVNDKSEEEKFTDFKLGMRISDAKQGLELKSDDVVRIKKLAHYLDTENLGALYQHIDK